MRGVNSTIRRLAALESVQHAPRVWRRIIVEASASGAEVDAMVAETRAGAPSAHVIIRTIVDSAHPVTQ